MAKFIFLQPYTIRTGNISITSQGATGGTIVKSFNTGDIIEGVKKSMSAGQPNLPPIVTIETVVDGKTYPIADFLVKEYTGASSPTTDNKSGSTPFVWTPMKKVFAGALAIGAIFGILKLAKVI
jgi:hypothetical protein